MTKEEARANQERIARDYDLAFWYGVRCRKCCGVFPRLMVADRFGGGCWYECEVCGKRTNEKVMPWVSEEAWNAGEFVSDQIKLF